MMLRVAFRDSSAGIPICYRIDGDLFDLRRLQAASKVQTAIIRDLLFADDCAFVVHSTTALQTLFTQFFNTAKRFGLMVSMKKTETMFQAYPLSPAAKVTVMAGETHLTSDDRFCYLGSYLSNTITVDIDVSSRLAKAGDAFGKLQRRLWDEYSVALPTKIVVYQAVVLSTLLYGCESWVLYRRSVRRLDEFHEMPAQNSRYQNDRTECRTQKYYASAALKPSYWQDNFAGLDTSSVWTTCPTQHLPLVIRQTLTVWSTQALQGHRQGQYEEVWSAAQVTEHGCT